MSLLHIVIPPLSTLMDRLEDIFDWGRLNEIPQTHSSACVCDSEDGCIPKTHSSACVCDSDECPILG